MYYVMTFPALLPFLLPNPIHLEMVNFGQQLFLWIPVMLVFVLRLHLRSMFSSSMRYLMRVSPRWKYMELNHTILGMHSTRLTKHVAPSLQSFSFTTASSDASLGVAILVC